MSIKHTLQCGQRDSRAFGFGHIGQRCAHPVHLGHKPYVWTSRATTELLRNWRRLQRVAPLYWSSKYQFPFTVFFLRRSPSSFSSAFATRLFSQRCRNQIRLTSSSRHRLLLFFYDPQPITVFKSKANENNPHSWLAAFTLLTSILAA